MITTKVSVRIILIVLLFYITQGYSQRQSKDAYVDKNGVIRWGDTREEIHAFGVNYTAPFAHAYRTAIRMGVDLEKAIDNDVYHFARLGFDAYRVHIWDTEISDTVGNLLENEHLRLFDYMIKKMKDRGMKFILTPIAYWGNGWPEPDDKSPGFSRKYGKGACLTNTDALRAQENYLYQFLNHVNSYTGVAYKSDPDVIAFEVSNEPHHNEPPEEVTEFINRMVKSMRNTGCKKPIFYNVSHSIQLADAYFNSKIQGGTFQWYPSGLGARHELQGNYLPHVDNYKIPFADHPKFKRMAKIVYEFDAADIGRTYIYPAMARSFREAGMQVATHFAYDPTYMAHINTEYGTHYMNLAFAPQKALSLMIASEVFHSVPLYKSFGRFPSNTKFDSFNVSYESDLAEMVTEKKFIYTNSTNSSPVSTSKLELIAGSGNSSVVSYEGTGAYFLNRIQEGIWRLEVMPDAIWIEDPFTRTSPKKTVAVINRRLWPMKIDLSELGGDFKIRGINSGNSISADAIQGEFAIQPGTYLIHNKEITSLPSPSSAWRNITLNEFVAPESTVDKTYVIHQPSQQFSAGNEYEVNAVVVTKNPPEEVELHVWAGFRPSIFKMKKHSGYTYTATIPKENIQAGMLTYFISVTHQGQSTTFPGGVPTHPRDWDFYSSDRYTVPVVQPIAPMFLFNAESDNDEVMRQWVRGSTLVPTGVPGKSELQIPLDKVLVQNSETFYGKPIYDYSLSYAFGNKIEGRRDDVAKFKTLVVQGRSLSESPCQLKVTLVAKNGMAYQGIVSLSTDVTSHRVSLDGLMKARFVTLPRPYPTFLPYYFESELSEEFTIHNIETIQFSVGTGITQDEPNKNYGFALERVWLER